MRTALCSSALSLSHKATFRILKSIRRQLLAKLPWLPLGMVTDTASGKRKETIADQILVLDGGRIVRRGRREELIAQSGIYADFAGGRKETAGWKL